MLVDYRKICLAGSFLLLLAISGRMETRAEREELMDACAGKCSARTSGGPDNNPVRIAQAKHIIEENHQFTKSANILIAQAERSINEAARLKGEARKYTKNQMLQAPKLKGKALSDAKRQFQLDLAQFAKHSKEYRLHTDAVRQQFGHCQASLSAYEKHKRELELHCDQFHLPNIEPPHICLEMSTSAQEATSVANRLLEQGKRMAEAEKQLMQAEMRLNKSVALSADVDGIVRVKSELALREQALAAEFGRLKEEHRQLDVERKVLQRSGAVLAIPKVKGKLKS